MGKFRLSYYENDPNEDYSVTIGEDKVDDLDELKAVLRSMSLDLVRQLINGNIKNDGFLDYYENSILVDESDNQ